MRTRILLLAFLLATLAAFGQTTLTNGTFTAVLSADQTRIDVTYVQAGAPDGTFAEFDAWLDGEPLARGVSPGNNLCSGAWCNWHIIPTQPAGAHTIICAVSWSIPPAIATDPGRRVTFNITSSGSGYSQPTRTALPSHTESQFSFFGHYARSIFDLYSLSIQTDSTLQPAGVMYPTFGSFEEGVFDGLAQADYTTAMFYFNSRWARIVAVANQYHLKVMISGDDATRNGAISNTLAGDWHTDAFKAMLTTIRDSGICEGIVWMDEADLNGGYITDGQLATFDSITHGSWGSGIRQSWGLHDGGSPAAARFLAISNWSDMYYDPNANLNVYYFGRGGDSINQLRLNVENAARAAPVNKPFTLIVSAMGSSAGVAGISPINIAASIWMAFCYGASGDRVYSYDVWASGRTGPDANGQYSTQIGATPTGVGSDRWAAMSYNFNLLNALNKAGKLNGTRVTNLNDWGYDIIHTTIGAVTIAINASEGTRPLPNGTAAPTYRILGTSSPAAFNGTMRPAEIMIWVAGPPPVQIASATPTRQQALVTFQVDDPANCTVTVYSDAAMTQKMDDTNNAIFAGSENCNRAGNIINGNTVTAVVGTRSAPYGTDNKHHSRSLAVATPYWVQIVSTGTQYSASTQFSTLNIPWGDTHVELPAVDNTAFGGYAYPDLDWTDAGAAKSYVDQVTGVPFLRGPRDRSGDGGNYGDGPHDVHIFDPAIDVHGTWSNLPNALSTTSSGPFASYAGTTQDAIFLPFPSNVDGIGTDAYSQPFRSAFHASDDNSDLASIDDVAAVICGSSTSSVAEDRKVLACLGVNYIPGVDTCPGPEIEVTLNQNTATCTTIPGSYPTWQFAGWNVGRYLNSEETGISGGNNATVVNSIVTLGGNDFLPANAAANWKVHIGSNWYTIAQVFTAQRFNLVENSINLGTTTWYTGNFGVRIRKKTTTNNQISVSAGFSYVRSHHPKIDPNGQSRDYCSRLTFPVTYQADGVTALSPSVNGRLCVNGGKNQSIFILMDTGETRYLGPVAGPSANGQAQFPMLGAFSNTSATTFYSVQPDPTDLSGGNSFWRGMYDSTTCKFKPFAGNGYNRNNSVSADCINWTPMNPYSAGSSGTIQGQIDAALAANPIWDSSLTKNFILGGISGNYAVLSQFAVTQNGPCFAAVFELTNFTLVKLFDSFSGAIPGLRWAGCHSNGIALADGTGNAAFDLALNVGSNYNGYLSGPFDLPAFTAKSLDGGTTWNSDTSLTYSQATTCGTNPYGVSGTQCVKFKLPKNLPCNMNSGSVAATRWPCTWSANSNHSASPLTVQAGDYISDGSRPIDGKSEKQRVLSIVSDGAGGWIIENQRWAVCDNPTSDPNGTPPACTDYTHPPQGNHSNGWAAYMAPSGSETWITLAGSNAATTWKSDDSMITSGGGHNAIGAAPDGTSRMEVGNATSRVGAIPAMAATPAQYTYGARTTTFNGISTADDTFELETYPSLLPVTSPALGTQYKRSLYWDWRHVNPSQANAGGDSLLKIWNHSYTLQSGTLYTYKVDTHSSLGTGAAILKTRPPVAWSTRVAFTDISSPATGNVMAGVNTYCLAYKSDECWTGSSPGDVYVNAPGAYIEFGGCIVNSLKTWSPCVSSLQSYAGWMIEGYTQANDPTRYRRITMGLSGPGAQYEYTSPHLSADGSLALVRPSWLNGIRPDYLVVKVPPPVNTDTVDRTSYVNVAVTLPAGSGYVRARFGYAENGTPTSFYCTTRQEACLTDSSLAPFAYAQSDTLTATNCTAGCTLNIPALSGRVLYYRLERSADGSTGWKNDPIQARPVN